jgi:hypothetical protein
MKHVLVVDDDPSIRDVIGSYLHEQTSELNLLAAFAPVAAPRAQLRAVARREPRPTRKCSTARSTSRSCACAASSSTSKPRFDFFAPRTPIQGGVSQSLNF